MSVTSETLFVRVPYLLEHFAVAVAAVSGVLAGRGKYVDLFGVLVLALVTAFGGGTLRDLMLGDLPIAWIRDSHFVMTASAAAIVTFFLARHYGMPRDLLLIVDAVGLALFTAAGARKALAFDVASTNAVVIGVITGVAGGMIRDVLTGEIPMVFRPQIYLYATAAILGASVLVIMAKSGLSPQTALLSGATVTLLLRLAAMHWKLRLPVFSERESAPLRRTSTFKNPRQDTLVGMKENSFSIAQGGFSEHLTTRGKHFAPPATVTPAGEISLSNLDQEP